MARPTEVFAIEFSDGDRYYLNKPYTLTEVQGLAMPPVTTRTAQAPFQHGNTYLGYSLEARVLNVIVHLRGCNRRNMWQMRREFGNLLNPLNQPFKFIMTDAEGQDWYLDNVTYDAGFEAGTEANPDPSSQTVAFRLIAQDPLWYAYKESTVTEIPVADAVTGLVVPLTIPFWIGAYYALSATETITPAGSFYSYPIIELTGPMDGALITNVVGGTTVGVISFSGTIEAGTTVTIDLRPGYKTVQDESTTPPTSYLGYISGVYSLSEFCLYPGVVNTVYFAATSGVSGSSSVVMRWRDTDILK